jgi:triosephosphate isomerase
VSTLLKFIDDENISDDVLIFPTASSLNKFDTPSNVRVGVQNAYPTQNGSFTGEIGLDQIEEFGIKTILIGHSERRHILGESQEEIAKKFEFFKEKDYEVVYCIGEPKEIREEGIEAVMEYNLSQLDGIDINYENMIVAYEPVWAIGTGLTATNEQIDETLNRLREHIKAPLLYGGSVKPTNTKEILSIKNCDGVLVGTASWKVDSFCQMLEISKQIS